MIVIGDAGPLTTVQDLGRIGQLRYGIPPAGAIDRFALVAANRLVGNADGAAALECTMMGPRFEVEAACAIAVTGADMPISVNGVSAEGWAGLRIKAGDSVKLGTARSGARGYIAISGGIDVPVALGSRSTYLRGNLGGYEGRALRRGDRLSVFDVRPGPLPSMARHLIPSYAGEPSIHVVLGPQADRFSAEGIAALLEHPYRMLPQSDRMGARLQGNPIAHTRGSDIFSDGIALGSVQVPGDGQPIILLVDRQSTGGYTKIATVCSFDIGRVGQLRPGQRLRFRAVELAQAHRLALEFDTALARIATEVSP